nr:hypothetical protein [Lentilactobacillus otakiensis]
MISNKIIKTMIFSGMTFLFLIGFATTANASSQYLSKLSNDQYLETRQTIHTTNSYFKDLKITIQGHHFPIWQPR